MRTPPHKHVRFSATSAPVTVDPATPSAEGSIFLAVNRAKYVSAGMSNAETLSLTDNTVVPGAIHAVKFGVLWHVYETNKYSTVGMYVKSAVAASTGALGIYTEDAPTGEPGTLIWYSGTLDLSVDLPGIPGFVAVPLTAGVWYDTSYKSGDNLSIPQGTRVYLAVFGGAANFGLRALQEEGTTFQNGVTSGGSRVSYLSATAPPAFGTPPDPFGAVTEVYFATVPPMLMLLPVAP